MAMKTRPADLLASLPVPGDLTKPRGSAVERFSLAATLVVLVAASPASSQPVSFLGSSGNIRLSLPRVEQGPIVDGAVDDAVWSQAAVLDSFTQSRPIEGVRDSLGTVCLVMYDHQNLYIGFRVSDDVKAVQAPIVPRDQIWQGDWVGVSLDTYHDQQRSFFLCANPHGIQMDGVDQEGRDSDMAPDFIYTSRGRMTERGYEVEMAIPFKSLRFPSHNPLTFGFNAIRDVKRNGAHLFWAPIRRDINSYHTQIGALEGITGIRPGRNLEINPTVTGSQLGTRGADAIAYDDLDSRFGLGLKLGLTSNLIADVAVTPDFSQVEADAGVVDINERFAIFYPEKRPFFLEGSDIFNSPIQLVYTRRIVDPLYGGKLTGKTGRTTMGLLHASDRSAADGAEGLRDDLNPYVDRNAVYNLARFKQDVLKNSYLGLLVGERQHRDAFNRGAGLDGRFVLRDKYSVAFQGVQSWSRDRDLSGAIAQLTPAEQAALDPELLGLAGERRQGTAWSAELARDTRPLNLGVSATGFSPDFAADMGFIRRTDQLALSTWVRPHLWSKGNTWYNAVHFPLYYERSYDYGGDRLTDETISVVTEVNLPLNSWFGGETVRRFIAHNGAEFPDLRRFALWAGSERYRTVRGGGIVVWGDQVVFAETVRGRDFFWELWSDLRFTSQFDGAFVVRSRTVWRDANDARFADAVIPRLRLSYQFNKELSLRWIGELQARRSYDAAGVLTEKARALTPDVLLSYVVRPGTVVYLGYGSLLEGHDTRSLRPSRSSFFTKLSYLWQV